MRVLREEDEVNFDNYTIIDSEGKRINSEKIDFILKTDLGDVIYYEDESLPDPQITRARIKIKTDKPLTSKEKKELLKMCGLYVTAKAMYEIKYEGVKP